MGYRKLGVRSDHRKAMLRNLVTALLVNEKIQTTETRAKELRKVAEKIVTVAKTDNLAARRQAFSFLRDEKLVNRLFTEIAPRYQERPGGYTRIIKTMPRKGDAAPMAIIELVK